MLAREYCDKLKIKEEDKPIILSHRKLAMNNTNKYTF